MADLLIRWGPLPETPQEDFFDDDTPDADILFAGGYGAGKTMTVTGKGLKLSAINAPIPILWTVPQWSHVERTIIPTLQESDPNTGERWFLEDHQFVYNSAKHVLSWDGGGTIQFASAEHENSIKGPNIAAALLDEPGIMSQRAWRNSMARVRHPGAPLRQRVAAGTPEGLNWLMEYFGDEAERPENVHVYHMDTRLNTELPIEYIEQLKRNATEAELESYLSGRFTNLTGALAYPAFDSDTHWRQDVELDPALPLRIAFDFNVDPMACVIGQQSPGAFGDEARIVDAVVINSSVVMDVCDQIIERYPTWQPGIFVYGDATGQNRSTVSRRSNYDIIRDMLSVIGRVELRLPRQNPHVSQRLNSVNRMLRDARGAVRCVIKRTVPKQDCRTRHLVRSLQQSTKKPGTNDLWKKPGETVTHAADALGYWIDYEWPALKPSALVTTMHPARAVHPSSAIMAARARRSRAMLQQIEESKR